MGETKGVGVGVETDMALMEVVRKGIISSSRMIILDFSGGIGNDEF